MRNQLDKKGLNDFERSQKLDHELLRSEHPPPVRFLISMLKNIEKLNVRMPHATSQRFDVPNVQVPVPNVLQRLSLS